MEEKTEEKIVSEDRIRQRVVIEVLLVYGDKLTIGEIKDIARLVSVGISNCMFSAERRGFSLTDEKANSVSYWIDKITKLWRRLE